MTTEEKSTRPGAYIHANGLDIYYEEYGSGYPLLLIHGSVVNLTMWEEHIPIFAQHFRVIALDIRGHGRTKNTLDTLSYRLLADDMAAFIHALGVQQPFVCGYSLGGQIGLEMGINYPQLAKAYILAGAMYKREEGLVQIVKQWGVDAPGVIDIARTKRDSPDIYQMLLTYQAPYQGVDCIESVISQCSHLWLAEWHYTVEELSKIETPTLVLSGDRDEFISLEQALYMYRTIPQAELAIVPGAGHHIAVELFNALILDFLLRQSSPSA